MLKQSEHSNTSRTVHEDRKFGLDGAAPPIEYAITFIQEYLFICKSFTIPRKLTEEGLGYLCKAAWIAFNRELTPSEYLQTLFSKYQRMPIPTIPRPDQLATDFSVDVVDAEVIKKVEVPPEIRAHEFAKKNHSLRLDHDSQYKTFIAEFKSVALVNVADAEFKIAYCRMREVQTTGEPSEVINELQMKIAIIQGDHGGGNG